MRLSFKSYTSMERSSRNFQPSSSNRKFQAVFTSSNRHFTENSRWVLLISRSSSCPRMTIFSSAQCSEKIITVQKRTATVRYIHNVNLKGSERSKASVLPCRPKSDSCSLLSKIQAKTALSIACSRSRRESFQLVCPNQNYRFVIRLYCS